MTPRQRATAYEMLERLEQVAGETLDKGWIASRPGVSQPYVVKLAGAIMDAAKALREALPEPNEPDQW